MRICTILYYNDVLYMKKTECKIICIVCSNLYEQNTYRKVDILPKCFWVVAFCVTCYIC